MTKRSIFTLLFAFCVLITAIVCLCHNPLALVSVLTCGAGVAGTITATAVEKTNNYKSWTITALDADTSTSFAHGFGSAPDQVLVENELQPSTTVAFLWGVTVNATNITLMKAANAGSGGASAGTSIVAKVYAWRPHSVAR